MEARVDIKKLQLLNDRIVQTIDALNQVRLSVHGLQHASGVQAGIGPFAANPMAAAGLGNPVIGNPAMGSAYSPYAAPFGPGALSSPYGLSHTSLSPYSASPFAVSPFAAFGAVNPYAAQALYAQQLGQVGALGAAAPWAWSNVGGGLSHSTIEEQWIAEARAQDPRRLAATFPFCGC